MSDQRDVLLEAKRAELECTALKAALLREQERGRALERRAVALEEALKRSYEFAIRGRRRDVESG